MKSFAEWDAAFRRWNIDRKRLPAIAAELPEAIDLMALVMQAGLDFQVALHYYIEHAPPGVLKEELTAVHRDIQLGTSRVDALRNLCRRVPEPGLRETARSIIQGIELGSCLTPLLRSQAQALRRQYAYRAEKRAAQAPIKLLFPLLVFIFPTVFVVLLGPLALKFCDRVVP